MPQLFSRSRGAAPGWRSRGVSLVEVLVAVVVLSLGILSIVALQLVSKRTGADAGSQALAAQLMYDITERMRLNSRNDALTEYLVKASDGIGRGQQTAPSSMCTSGSPCTPLQLADYDVWLFERQLDGVAETMTSGGAVVGGLVNPTACITGPAGGASGIYTISIVWRSKTAIANNTAITCGDSSDFDSLYGTAAECAAATGNAGSGTHCFRRAMSVQTYISF
jgi:type IV pilus assembly protein PilV